MQCFDICHSFPHKVSPASEKVNQSHNEEKGHHYQVQPDRVKDALLGDQDSIHPGQDNRGCDEEKQEGLRWAQEVAVDEGEEGGVVFWGDVDKEEAEEPDWDTAQV